MSKLDPKPEKNRLYTWEDLNDYLQLHFKSPGSFVPTIDVRQYSMTKEEIISEAETQGYKVSQPREHILKFE
ncbi:Uncharacterised protein [Niallia circulans]|uniref:hypothetical protein n=1 Tax=Niallia TaxID=2837506 RepID=UPI00077C8197|nr:hypothetical protein [Niallia circulans]MDR4314982.1 hypothetical protein [Niallia circulans]MED3841732.1 hypothetical protein [Niallia circulans]MED4243153.1 hypothetical protein [Niallia circulans]MED4247132.1 hypothetical protein [Niallia circulans]QKH61666.1 hypothetical protein FOC77_13905 [Niallia circulans]